MLAKQMNARRILEPEIAKLQRNWERDRMQLLEHESADSVMTWDWGNVSVSWERSEMEHLDFESRGTSLPRGLRDPSGRLLRGMGPEARFLDTLRGDSSNSEEALWSVFRS